MKRFVLALQFLTVFPVKKDISVTKEDLSCSMAWFPLVGAVQGLILVLANFLLSTALPESVVSGLLLLILALTNGGFHLDGFADTVDGLAGGKTPEERLRIMKDSASGAIGVAFVVLHLLVKYLSIQELPLEAKAPALFLFPVVGRWSMVPLGSFSNYARPEGGLGAAFTGVPGKVLFKASVLAAALSVLAIGIFSVLLLIALGIGIYLSALFFRKKTGGVTGDIFGFQSEIAESAFLIMVLALSNVLAADV